MAKVKYEPTHTDQQEGRKLRCPVCWKSDVVQGSLFFDKSTSTIIYAEMACRLCMSQWRAVWYINEVELVFKEVPSSVHFILTPSTDPIPTE